MITVIVVCIVWFAVGNGIPAYFNYLERKAEEKKRLEDPRTGRDPEWVRLYEDALRQLNEGLDPDEERLKREIEPPPEPKAVPVSLGSLPLYQALGLQHQQYNLYAQQQLQTQLGSLAQAANAQAPGQDICAGLRNQQRDATGRPVSGLLSRPASSSLGSILDQLLGGHWH